MRIFERVVCKQELSSALKSKFKSDRFVYKEGQNTTMALIKCQHHWLNWLDKGTYFVKVPCFDFSKAFHSVSHKIVCDKLKFYNWNPFIINCIISFLSDRKQRVVVDGVTTKYVDINRGILQVAAVGPVLFSIVVNDIQAVILK